MTYFSKEIHLRTILEGCDVPEECPSHTFPISEVGLTNKTVWVQLPEGKLPFSLTLLIDLAADRRGIHMSRMEEALSELAGDTFSDLLQYAEKVAILIVHGQSARYCRVQLCGQMPVEKTTAVSGRISHDTVQISAEVELRGDEKAWQVKKSAGLSVCHMTACPCTQRYAATALGADALPCPLPTHTQRSVTELKVQTNNACPSYSMLYKCLDTALHLSQDLLKRPDEAEFVLKVHDNPQFAEDAVRQTAAATAHFFSGMLPRSSLIEISSRSFESIHIHDVQCRLLSTLGELFDAMQNVAGREADLDGA